MKLNFLSKQSNKTTDPVCLMKVEKSEKALAFKYKEKTYYFCSENCRQQFKEDSDKYLE